jgi:SOS-response transcriptional repressor LexA
LYFKELNSKKVINMSQHEKRKLNEVLTQLMQEVEINEAELARKANIPQPTLHRILSGATKSPRGSSMAPMANFFSVTINQLMGVDELPEDRVAGTHNSRIYGWSPVPVISWSNAANWKKFQQEMHDKQWNDWVSTDLTVSDKAFAIQIKGDAMAPTFVEGQYLIIEPTLEPENRDYVIVAAKNAKNASFRQLLVDGDDYYLRPVSNEFRTMQLDNSNKIIGTLIQTRMDFYRDPLQSEVEEETK